MSSTPKDLEVIAIAISIAAGCNPCTRYHVREAQRRGASLVDAMHILTLASSGSSSDELVRVARHEVLKGFESSAPITTELRRRGLLAELGVCVCRNDVKQLKAITARAQEAGLTDGQIMETIGLAERIKEKAASHLDSVTQSLDADPIIAKSAAKLCS